MWCAVSSSKARHLGGRGGFRTPDRWCVKATIEYSPSSQIFARRADLAVSVGPFGVHRGEWVIGGSSRAPIERERESVSRRLQNVHVTAKPPRVVMSYPYFTGLKFLDAEATG
ncbi:Uncharacterised protein [Mycobacteroides abscessus subsp. abscessus]|nr:Uncharacterised protein [Mycobacteroides abscessus subsp. abscessus]SHP66959.1 Uncharacterised protein [Mycobacteroides abscessus subsp. abscessus]SHY38541.1 Uncharacterised protein [Mycobacteroides abscessus subsp. abscessus]SKD95090.1 Uncharacterised protein [Mycobacteroides abscessus subsp. abscessus]